MAAIPPAINIIDNHFSLADDEQINGANKFHHAYYQQIIAPSAALGHDKEQLIGGDHGVDDVEEGERKVGDDRTDIRSQYTKMWPFGVLKVANWLILLLLLIGTTMCASYHLWWSKYWQTVFRERPYQMGDQFAISQWVLFTLSSASLTANLFIRKSTKGNLAFMASLFSLMDVCISALCVPILLVVNMIFTLISLAEYRWFVPKLAAYYDDDRGEEQLAALTETLHPDRGVSLYGIGPGWDGWERLRMAERKNSIMMHLVADPLIAFFSVLGVLLNIALLVCVYRIMRRCGIWAAAGNNNNNIGSAVAANDAGAGSTTGRGGAEVDQLETEYSKHYPYGVLKSLQWLVPMAIVFTYCYIPLFKQNIRDESFLVGLGFVASICFAQWLFYFCKIHLRAEITQRRQLSVASSNKDAKNGADAPLLFLIFMDCIISVCMLISIGLTVSGQRYMTKYQNGIVLLCAGINCASLFLAARLFMRSAGHRSQLLRLPSCLPRISIEIKFIVKKEGEKEEENDGKSEEKEGKSEEKEKAENGKKKGGQEGQEGRREERMEGRGMAEEVGDQRGEMMTERSEGE